MRRAQLACRVRELEDEVAFWVEVADVLLAYGSPPPDLDVRTIRELLARRADRTGRA